MTQHCTLQRTLLSTILRLIRGALLSTCLIVALGACDQSAVVNPAPTTVTIAGSTAMRPVLLALTASFAEQHPNALFDLRRGGSTLGEEWARAGRVDIAASTLLAEAEPPGDALAADGLPAAAFSSQAAAGASALVRTPIGLDGIAVITHPATRIDKLTLLELHDLYTGKIIEWSALGGTDASVLLVSREGGSGTRRLFETRVVGDETVSLASIVMPTSEAVVKFVAENPGAIGYVSRAYVIAHVEADAALPGPAVQVVAVDGALPTKATLRAQAYPLPQPLYLVTQGAPTGVARQFIDFALSPAGQEIVGRYHLPVREPVMEVSP